MGAATHDPLVPDSNLHWAIVIAYTAFLLLIAMLVSGGTERVKLGTLPVLLFLMVAEGSTAMTSGCVTLSMYIPAMLGGKSIQLI